MGACGPKALDLVRKVSCQLFQPDKRWRLTFHSAASPCSRCTGTLSCPDFAVQNWDPRWTLTHHMHSSSLSSSALLTKHSVELWQQSVPCDCADVHPPPPHAPLPSWTKPLCCFEWSSGIGWQLVPDWECRVLRRMKNKWCKFENWLWYYFLLAFVEDIDMLVCGMYCIWIYYEVC